jgi:hypothetical protein
MRCIQMTKTKTRKRGWFKPNGEWHESTSPRMDIGTREHGVVERICKHGVGHPIGHVKEWIASWMGVHGCDGCCSGWGEDGMTSG